MRVSDAVLSQSVIIKYKGESAVKRCEIQVLFFYHRPFLLYISLLFAVSVTLSAAVTGHNRTVFCFLDKILFSASTPTRNHRETWSVMSDTPFVFVPLSRLKDSELTPHQPITPEYNRKNRGMLPVRKKGGESKASPHW